MNKSKKFLITAVIIVTAVAIAFYLIKTRPKKDSAKITERVWRVESAKISKSSFSPQITLYGKAESPDLVHLSFPSLGKIEKVLVKEGEYVSEGDVLAMLEKDDFLPQYQSAEAKINDIEAQIEKEKLQYRQNNRSLSLQQELLSLREASLQRNINIQKQKLASQAEVDTLKQQVVLQKITIESLKFQIQSYDINLKRLYASLEQAKADLSKARLLLDRTEIIAPYHAIISEVNVSAGDFINANENLISLYPENSIEIRSKIPAKYTEQLKQMLKNHGQISAQSMDKQADYQLKRLSGQSSASGTDAFFMATEGNVNNIGDVIALNLSLPEQNNLFSIPAKALYGQNKLYRIVEQNDEYRLESIEIKLVGRRYYDNKSLILFSAPELKNEEIIMMTHLPNAVNGLRVELTDS